MSWKDCVVESIDRVDLNVNGLRGYAERQTLDYTGERWEWTVRMPQGDEGDGIGLLRSGDVRGDIFRSRFKTKEEALENMYEAMVRLDASGIKVVDSKEKANEVYRIARGE